RRAARHVCRLPAQVTTARLPSPTRPATGRPSPSPSESPMKTALLPLSLSLCFPLLAQDAPTMTLTYKDGESCSAQVVALKGDEVKLKVFVLGGSMQITRRLDDFVPLSAYAIELQAHKPVTFDDHFAMARRAVDAGLVPQAGVQARAALEAAAGKAPARATH